MRKILLGALVLMACLFRADAQLLVYDLSFNAAGPSVNYSFLEGGYLVVDVSAQAVTSVVILTDPTTQLQYYTTGLLSGTYMEMIEEGSGSEYAVIYSNSGSTSGSAGGDNIAFQILGKTSKNTGVGSGDSLSIAKKLRGYLLASAAESPATTANSTTSNSTSSNSTFTYGFAGASKVTASLQSGLTSDANNNRLDAAGALDNLTQVLENRGIFSDSSLSSNSTTSNTTTTSNSTSPQ